MPGFEVTSHDEQEPHDARTAARNARIGLVLFIAYSFVYAGFVVANAFLPEWMASKPWAGINLAVLSGLGLIIGAFLLSLVYGWLCRAPVPPAEPPTRGAA
jgi:uncharacterized membrane protein (DUF485 family)